MNAPIARCCSARSSRGRLQAGQMLFYSCCFGPKFAQIGFQLGDALVPADEPPPEAIRRFRMVTVVFVATMMSFMPTLAAAAALGLATSTLAAASFRLARTRAATSAVCLLAVAAPTLMLVVVSTATPVSAFASATTSALSAHRLQPPVVI